MDPNDQPNGPVREIDGIRYRVVRRYAMTGRKDTARWDLQRLNESGAAEVDAFVVLPATATVADAEKRLLG